MPPEHKYTKIERERRFLLDQFPKSVHATRVRRITDRYIDGTTVRLREQSDDGGPTMFKLTQKIPAGASGAQQGLITTIYLTRDEFCVFVEQEQVVGRVPASRAALLRWRSTGHHAIRVGLARGELSTRGQKHRNRS